MRLMTSLVAILAASACSQQHATETDPSGAGLPIAISPLSDNTWYQIGQETLKANLAKKPIDRTARNVILFIADGMDPTTVTAARIYDGQSKGMSGEENVLTFENLPHLAMAKTYNTNMQTPDSAGTASAMMTGVKTKAGVINITDDVLRGDCTGALAHPAMSIGELAEKAGMSVGVVTTAGITHATPATVYAHSADRGWEADSNLPEQASDCTDIASQLINFPIGDGLEVALGGGRRNFLPVEAPDPEYTDKTGRRNDGRDLTSEWTDKSDSHSYVWDTVGFNAVDGSKSTKLLGLFDMSHMQYEADRENDTAGEPSIAEMTVKAIDILSQNQQGFFLMVEGGRVDHAHHAGNAARALRDVQAFDEAVRAALENVDTSETLIVVTADHGHTLSIQGYPRRGNPILGLAVTVNSDGTPSVEPSNAADSKPYPTLAYANGPGSAFLGVKEGAIVTRPEVTDETAQSLDYKQQSVIPSYSESHGGQDVTIYAQGPKAWLFDGVVEQNYVFHVIDHALNLQQRASVEDTK